MNKSTKKINQKEVSSYLLEKIEDNIYWEKKQKEIEKDLRTNPVYKDFFSQFEENSVNDFIENYPQKKQFYLRFGPMYKDIDTDGNNHHLNIAKEKLWEIQQKKLFNMQCQWRAEQINIPQISISQDFDVWEHFIKYCDFIEPISEEDIKFYKEYLKAPEADFDKYLKYFQWQDYIGLKKAYNNVNKEYDYPTWYAYYNRHKGTHTLFNLPDKRGEKERFYENIQRKWEKEQEIAKGTYKEYNPKVRKPWLDYSMKFIREFINKFEDQKLLEYCIAFEKFWDLEDDDQLNNSIKILGNADEKLPIYSGLPWRDAIIDAADNYTKQKVIELLPLAYEEYLEKYERGGWQQNKIKNDEGFKECVDIAGHWKARYLKGRELNGEPADLNF